MDSLTEVKALEAAETGGFEGRNLKEVRMTSSLIRCSVLALAAAALPAQDMRVTAHVPFGFEVQGKSMPAGDYVVSLLNTNSVILKCQEHSVIVSSNALVIVTTAEKRIESLVIAVTGFKSVIAWLPGP